MSERRRTRPLVIGVLGLCALLAGALVGGAVPVRPVAAGGSSSGAFLWVNGDGSCGGRTPCFPSIQEAVDAAAPESIIRVQAGEYPARLRILAKEDLVIERDPEAPLGSVVLRDAAEGPRSSGIVISRSTDVTLRGLTITDVRRTALHLLGRWNRGIVVEQCRIVATCTSACTAAVRIGRGNVGTVLLNNLIHENRGAGIQVTGIGTGPVWLVENTIHGNARSGIELGSRVTAALINNAITGNALGPRGRARYGVRVRTSRPDHAVGIRLEHNLLCGNGRAEVSRGPLGSVEGNVTPTGEEGAGFVAAPGCETAANVYENPDGEDETAGSGDETFSLQELSPAVDRGRDLREETVPIDPGRLLGDFAADDVRPADGDGSSMPAFDIGARERRQDDETPPTIMVTSPADGSTVGTTTPTIRIDFSDDDSGVDLSTYRLLLDGGDVTPGVLLFPDYAVYVVVSPLTPGPHTVIARIRDRAGHEATTQATFTVAVFRAIADCAPRSGTAPLTVTFRTRGEFTGGSIVRYRWDLDGNGSFDTNDPVARDYSRTFTRSGTIVTTLEVLNNLGQTATDTCTVTVEGSDPTATADARPSNGPVPLAVTLTCVGSDPDGTIALYEWDVDGNGTFDVSSATSGVTMHTYASVGTFVASCRVTDNDGRTAVARTTTTVIRPAPPGSPSVEATVTPATGNAPLGVTFGGTASDDGSIALWEWDFEGDGVFDFSSTASPGTSFSYANGGIFAATLRVTDNEGLVGIDTVEVVVNITASLSIPDDTFDPTLGETAIVRTVLGGGVPAKVFLRDTNGATVRTLFDGIRTAGTFDDAWDGRDDTDTPLPQGDYYAVLEYRIGGELRQVDMTNSTGGVRYNPGRNQLPGPYPFVFRPFDDDHLTFNFTIPANRGASEVQAFIGLFNVDTRFITLVDRVPFGVGTHTLRWDGLDSQGKFAVPPPGDAFLFGIFGFTLPDNAIFVASAPVLSSITVDPNFFDPSTPDFLTPTAPVATVRFDLDRMADLEFTVTNLTTGVILRRISAANVPTGAGRTLLWNGRADSGHFVDRGDYRLALRAIDSTGSSSLVRYALMRVYY